MFIPDSKAVFPKKAVLGAFYQAFWRPKFDLDILDHSGETCATSVCGARTHLKGGNPKAGAALRTPAGPNGVILRKKGEMGDGRWAMQRNIKKPKWAEEMGVC